MVSLEEIRVMTTHNMPQVNIASREFKTDPYPFYAMLRADAPVHAVPMPSAHNKRAWLITRYEDVVMVLKDDVRFIKNERNALSADQKKKLPWVPPMFQAFSQNILMVDG